MPKNYNYRDALKSATPIGKFIGAWVGKSPNDLDSGIDNGKCEEVNIEALIDKPVTIFGYSLRDGMNDRPFAIICLVPSDSDKIFVLINGGGVVVEKLRKVPDSSFPVSVTFKKENSKAGMRYFDMV